VNMHERFAPPTPERHKPQLPSFPVLLICASIAFTPLWISFLSMVSYQIVHAASETLVTFLTTVLPS
jgi:hypothetical protein